MAKVIIAIPSSTMVHADFMMSITTLAAYSMQQGIHVMLINKQRTRIEINRYGLVLMAQDQKADYILFLDSDMTFPPDTLVKLLNARVNVIACNAAKRQDPPTDVIEMYPNHEKKGVSLVKRAGMGIMLIDMQVFRRLKAPYFKAVWHEDTGTFTGEDWFFCDEVRRASMKIHCDHDLSKEIGHIGTRTFKLEDCK